MLSVLHMGEMWSASPPVDCIKQGPQSCNTNTMRLIFTDDEPRLRVTCQFRSSIYIQIQVCCIESRLVAAKDEGWGGVNQGFGTSGCKTIICRVDKQLGPTVEHTELYSAACGKP